MDDRREIRGGLLLAAIVALILFAVQGRGCDMGIKHKHAHDHNHHYDPQRHDHFIHFKNPFRREPREPR